MTTLRSTFDPRHGSIELELDIHQNLPPGTRLAFTSIVQLTPGEASSAAAVVQLASYHEFEPRSPQALEQGATWVISDLALSHRPRHANDGPVSAFLILPDATTAPVRSEPMRRLGNQSERVRRPEPDNDHDRPSLVPYPVGLELIDRRPSGMVNASFVEGPVAARRAWDAIASLDRRSGSQRLARSGGEGAGVRAAAASDLGDGGYRLDVSDAVVTLEAADAAGFRYAMVTLAQWLREGLPVRASVADRPRYRFRGLHIDLARQWFEPDVVCRLIDVAAWRKLSHLHLHLSDDEGWRLPVDSIPELESIAAVRGHGLPIPPMLGSGPEPVGRVYTRDEIAAWVARADELGVVLVPEIDMPAHLHAALTARPDLRDPDDTSNARSVQHFVDNVLVPGHPPTTEFVERVVDTLAELFPSSPWIHIGGDEVPEHAWRASPVVDRFKGERGLSTVSDVEAAFHRDLVQTVGARAGRKIGAWEEAAFSGGVRPGDGYVVAWRNAEASRQLAARGYDVVVAPGQAYYLDMAVDDDWWSRGMGWAGSTSLKDVCAFDPEAGWSQDELSHLLGVQACLWTECVHDARILDDFLFPRLDAIAERAWRGTIAGGAPSLGHRGAQLPRLHGWIEVRPDGFVAPPLG